MVRALNAESGSPAEIRLPRYADGGEICRGPVIMGPSAALERGWFPPPCSSIARDPGRLSEKETLVSKLVLSVSATVLAPSG
jgi:hypothetical protein